MACSDVLAEVGLWEAAAGFGETAISFDDPDLSDRTEVAWRVWRSGRPDRALELIARVPDDAHPLLPVLRAGAVATRDRTAFALTLLLDEVSRRPPDGLTLKIVALAAAAVGDRGVARDAAARYLATVDGEDVDMCRLTAVVRAADGDLAGAVDSTELACGHPGDQDASIDAVAAELHRRGHSAAAYRFLAEGFHRTGRPVYGRHLVNQLPSRIQNRFVWMIAPVVVGVVVLFAFLAIGPHGPWGTAVQWLAPLIGTATSFRAMLMRVPGTRHAESRRIEAAVAASRHTSVLAVGLLGIAAGGFTFGLMLAKTLDLDALPTLGVATLNAAAGSAIVVLIERSNAGARASTRLAERVATDRCRCWERDWFAGPAWQGYVADHLEVVHRLQVAAAGRPTAVRLLCCPTTGKAWLNTAETDLTIRIALPRRPAPASRPSAACHQG